MYQQVEVTLKLNLWVDAKLEKPQIIKLVRESLDEKKVPAALRKAMEPMQRPLEIERVREEAEIFHLNA